MRKPNMNPLLNGLTFWFLNCDMQNAKPWGKKVEGKVIPITGLCGLEGG